MGTRCVSEGGALWIAMGTLSLILSNRAKGAIMVQLILRALQGEKGGLMERSPLMEALPLPVLEQNPRDSCEGNLGRSELRGDCSEGSPLHKRRGTGHPMAHGARHHRTVQGHPRSHKGAPRLNEGRNVREPLLICPDMLRCDRGNPAPPRDARGLFRQGYSLLGFLLRGHSDDSAAVLPEPSIYQKQRQ